MSWDNRDRPWDNRPATGDNGTGPGTTGRGRGTTGTQPWQLERVMSPLGQVPGQLGRHPGQRGEVVGQLGKVIGQSGQRVTQLGCMLGQWGYIQGQWEEVPVDRDRAWDNGKTTPDNRGMIDSDGEMPCSNAEIPWIFGVGAPTDRPSGIVPSASASENMTSLEYPCLTAFGGSPGLCQQPAAKTVK